MKWGYAVIRLYASFFFSQEERKGMGFLLVGEYFLLFPCRVEYFWEGGLCLWYSFSL